MIICNIIVIPNKKPRFQKEFIWRGQGYDCKWDFIEAKIRRNQRWSIDEPTCRLKESYCPVAPKDKKHKMRERDDGDKKFTKIRSPV